MRKRLFVGIGVHAPTGMDVLPGVDQALARMADYAARNPTYDDPIVLSDDAGGHVSEQQMCIKLTDDVLKNRPRIMVYFCGHGALLNGNEIWYLSDGHEKWRERVDVMQFRDMLLSYGARQVSIFSDACQTPEADQGNGTPIIDKGSRQRNSFKVDVFRATMPGKPAFASASGGPLFSKTILDVLDQDPPPQAALDRQYLAMGKEVVSSQSLSAYVDSELPDVAAGVHKTQYAQMAPGLVFDKDDYLILSTSDEPSLDPQDPTEPQYETASTPNGLVLGRPMGVPTLTTYATRYSVNPTKEDVATRINASLSEWRQDFWAQGIEAINEADGDGNVVVLIKHFDSAVGPPVLHLPGQNVAFGEPLDTHNFFGGTFFAFDVWKDKANEQMYPAAVLEYGADFAPLQLNVARYLNMILSLRPKDPFREKDEYGVDALGWLEVGFPADNDPMGLHPMQALKGLINGIMGPESLAPIAAELRLRKHSDPLFGIVAAYLYDRAGDTTSIRRMCSYYARFEQAVPFDIAMLSRLPFTKTNQGYTIDVPEIDEDEIAKLMGNPEFVWTEMDAVSDLQVSGFAPVLQMGWGRMRTLLGHSDHLEPLYDLRRFTSLAPFPTFHGDEYGHHLIYLMNKFCDA